MGNSNIDLLNLKCKIARAYSKLLIMHGFGIVNKVLDFATCVTESSRTLIDHILSDKFNYSFQMLLLNEIIEFLNHKYILISVDTGIRKKDTITQIVK